VRTPDCVVLCRRVLVCTNAYGPLLLPQLSSLITARRGQMMAVEAPGARLDCSYYANHGSEYLRQAADGRIVVGGCRTYHADREVGYEDATSEWVQRDLERFAGKMLGEFTIRVRWAGTMGFSPDGLPIVGPVAPGPGDGWSPGAVWFCGGFTGHGMSMAHRTSEAAVGAMLDGSANPFPIERFSGEPSAGARSNPAPQAAGKSRAVEGHTVRTSAVRGGMS
jgi:glycine/D-amino acid oxidase-like deaminating enzyme